VERSRIGGAEQDGWSGAGLMEWSRIDGVEQDWWSGSRLME
jgi:hypothetical protein